MTKNKRDITVSPRGQYQHPEAGRRVLAGVNKGAGSRDVVLSGRCGTCGYLLTSPGHKVACG